MTPDDIANAQPPAYRSRWRRFSPSMGWKAFWSEILIVVLGVAIALAASEAVADWNWRNKVADGRVRLAGDAQRIFLRSAEQYATLPCVGAQLDRLVRTVLESDDTLKPATVHADASAPTDPPFVLRIPTRPWSLPTWEALVADGTATRFSPQWQNRYSVLNDGAAQIRDHRTESSRLIGRLTVLSYPIPLDASARRDSLVEIEALRSHTVWTTIIGSRLMASLLRDGAAPGAESVDAFLQASGTVMFCKKHGLPLADWREVKPAPPDR